MHRHDDLCSRLSGATPLRPLRGGLIACLLLAGLGAGAQAQTAKFQPGDRVQCDPTQTGRFTAGTVVPFAALDMDKDSGRWYRVKLDTDRIANSTSECMAAWIRPLAASPPPAAAPPAAEPPADSGRQAAPAAPPPRAAPLPPAAVGPRPLPGTAWKIDFGKGVTGTVFLFCRGGARWEIVPASAGSLGAVGKSYRVAGSTLTTVNRDDGQSQAWDMAWAGNVLVLNDGRQALRLHYNGQTQCR